ncbi:MAG: YdbH domain-containing protein [Gammaproteobacteria bacterium]|nr:YdbH domain-containing protein [Gammaproteobacteria bacterium]MDH3362199.1 YdbH domain-containing protein [Gammaproteobacteria bacterium]MDH3480348.1 YdbH domain-containing protein [Gammaproteobacteria bacterium]
MKAAKYILVAAAVVAVGATAVWFLRDSLIQRLSNPLLREYGFSVTYVSLDALATRDASIGYLELLHDNGTIIAVRDLKLPIRRSRTGSKTYRASEVSVVTPADTDGEPLALVQLIDRLLLLPDNLGDIEVIVDEFSLAPYAKVNDVHWMLAKGEQTLWASVASIPMTAAITRTDTNNHALVFSLPTGAAPARDHLVSANLRQGDQGISLTGDALLDLPTWEPVARLAGIVPAPIDIQSGTAALNFAVDIPGDATQSPTVRADLAPTSPLQLSYSSSPDKHVSIVVAESGPVTVTATFPEITWSLQHAQSSLYVTYGEWQKIPLAVSSLACHHEPACSLTTRVTMNNATLPFGKVNRIEFVSAIDAAFLDDGVRVNTKPGATIRITGLSAAERKVGSVEADLVSMAGLDLIDAGWRFAADSVNAKIGTLSVADDMALTMPLFLENVVISELNAVLTATSGVYAASGQVAWNDQRIGIPGFKGKASLQGADMAADLETVGLQRNGTVKARHNLESSVGRLSVVGATVSLGAQRLSRRVTPWRSDWDLIAGTVAIDLDASWKPEKSNLIFKSDSSIAAVDIAGYYTDTALTGLSTRMKIAYREPLGFAAEPSTVSVALIEMGFPVENVSAAYELDLNARSVYIQGLRMTAFGGTVRADSFSFHTATDSNTLTLHAESIDLTELLTLQELEAIEVRGRIGASLPVTIESGTITIVGGSMTGEPPGGVIRYRPAKPPDRKDTSGIAMATRALSNFEFKTLTSDVNLTRDGDLNLQLQLTGRNPDLDEKRPVVLNLGVENNIPQMLKSLQAARTVEDILAKRLKK